MNIIRKGLMRYAKPFFTTSKGFAEGMRGLSTLSFFGIMYGLIGYEYFVYYKNIKKRSDVSPHVDKFVRKTLKKYGYPEWLYRSIRFEQGSFEVFFNTMYIPFTKEQLYKAQALHTGNTNAQIQNNESCKMDKLTECERSGLSDFLPENCKDAIMEVRGFAVNKDTLTQWQAAILHEASHAYHKDSLKQLSTLLK